MRASGDGRHLLSEFHRARQHDDRQQIDCRLGLRVGERHGPHNFGKHPALRLEWGLHASSIREHFGDLKSLDPRVVIVWEDAGGMPYSYDPEAPASAVDAARDTKVRDAAIEYSEKLATFRPGSEFAMCSKGWIQLRWPTESEPHGSFLLGEHARVHRQSVKGTATPLGLRQREVDRELFRGDAILS